MTAQAKDIVTPTFILGGAPKAGTTSLYHYLDQHPEVCMSARKETSVFIDNKGLEWLSENYYQHYAGEPAVGEASAGTLGGPGCCPAGPSGLTRGTVDFYSSPAC